MKDFACNNVPGKSIPVKLADQENGEREQGFRFLDQVAGKPKRGVFWRKRRRAGRALPELSIPVTSRVYFSAAQLYTTTYSGDTEFVYFVMSMRVAPHPRETRIFILLLKRRKKERKVGAKETRCREAIGGRSPMTETRQKQKEMSCGLA